MDHRVTTAAIPRPWFEAFVAGLFDAVTKRSDNGVYAHRDFTLRTAEWSRSGVAAGTLDLNDDDSSTVEFELLTVPSPERLRLSGDFGAGTWRGEIDLVEWMADAVVRHRLFEATVNMLVADVDAPRWGVVVRVDIVPKSWGRVLWPLARIFAYDRIRRSFQHAVEEEAAAWDTAAADLLRRHPADAAESLLMRGA